MTKPTITKGVASHYAGTHENIYDVGDGTSGGLLSVGRLNSNGQGPYTGSLVISAYRLDADVKVTAPVEHLIVSDAVVMSAQTVMELTSTALNNTQIAELQRRLFASHEFATLLQKLADETVEATP